MMNWWWTDDELMMNWWWTDDHRLPQTATDWLVLLHWTLKPISGVYTTTTTTIYIYIPDSTNYKSTASGAKKEESIPLNDLQI